jgi:hypothetical protein
MCSDGNMTESLRPWFFSANIFINGLLCRFTCGIINTNNICTNLMTEVNKYIIEKENKIGNNIDERNIQIIALNRAD